MNSVQAIRRLDELRLTDAPEVGGKAASLGELLAAGARVPAGFVLPVGFAAAPDVRSAALADAAAELGAGPFAVRSSGVAEDGSERSFAGMYETVLDVAPEDLPAAVDRCLASAVADRVADYDHRDGASMAVLVQRMVRPVAAGVALTADPVSGDRDSCVVTAVRGPGERLVSGAAYGDEWVVTDRSATPRRQPEHAIDRRQVMAVGTEARRIAAARAVPQDVEWAIGADGTLWILQARPMTALPPDVSWEPPASGAYTRQLRFGEWISEPVTPLFESWLLSTMEERLHRELRKWTGQRAPLPHHVVINGWYFYSINWISPGSMARSLPDILWHLVRNPRRVVGVAPPLVRHSLPLYERDWRDDLLPRYRATVASAELRVSALPVADLPSLIDELADLAGEYFASIATFAGAAYKMEMNLAAFYRRHLAGPLGGGSHLPLLAGFDPPGDTAPHAVTSLDWAHPPASVPSAGRLDNHGRVVETRRAAEEEAFAALEASPRRLRAFRELLAETQRLVPVREEHVGELTIAWPVMRRAVLRIGEALAAATTIDDPADVFYLTRSEALGALGALGGASSQPPVDVAGRRARLDEQARLVPPLLVGRLNRFLKRTWNAFPELVGAVRSEHALVSGSPASAGRAAGSVRVIRGPDQFDELQPGEILVAPLTAPAWTPLFHRAAAVVTDVGSAASHASIIAREFGIPAVVGCGDATARLKTGMQVTVDGGTGNVEPA
ncbi:MAG: PEP/pyruvate-binding domain-containing protein [Candidatus Limnocylindria bacterium]